MRQGAVLGTAILTVTALGACTFGRHVRPQARPSPVTTARVVSSPAPPVAAAVRPDDAPGIRRLVFLYSNDDTRQTTDTVAVDKGELWIRFACRGANSTVVVSFKPLGSVAAPCRRKGRDTVNRIVMDKRRKITFSVVGKPNSARRWTLLVSQK